MTTTVQIIWNLIGLDEFSKWCDYMGEGQKQYLYNCGDHHKTADFIIIVLQTLAREMCFQFMTIWKVEHLNKVPEFSDLNTWLESSLVQNPNIIRLFDILDGPLLSIFLLRAGVRTGNGEPEVE